MKSEPIIVLIRFTTERDAKAFASYQMNYIPGLNEAREAVKAELARRRKAKREAKKAAPVVKRQGDTVMLNRDWK